MSLTQDTTPTAAPRARRRTDRRPRLTAPLVREDGVLRPATWDEALDRAAAGLREIRDSYGGHALGMFSCSKATNETNYLAQKFARTVLETNNIDSCNRT